MRQSTQVIEELSSHPVMTEQLAIKETETELQERYKSLSSHSYQIFYSKGEKSSILRN